MPGLLNTLLNRLTSTRAGYLDNLTRLDSKVSDCLQASSTAATNMDSKVSDCLQAADYNSNTFKSVQQVTGTVTGSSGQFSTTETITSVTTSKTFLILSWSVEGPNASTTSESSCRATLTNSTTVTIDGYVNLTSGNDLNYTVFVVEGN